MMMNNQADMGGMDDKVNEIVEGEIRSGFIRKVYGILTVQLLLTGVIAYPITLMDHAWIIANRSLVQACMMISLVLVLGVSCCCSEIARKVPYNYLFLFVVTVCEAVIVGFVSAQYTAQSVVIAAFLTSFIFLGLTIFAMTTQTDFTGMGGYLAAAGFGLFGIMIVTMFFPGVMMQKVIGGLGAILFSFYIVYDTQLICGGKHKKHSFGVDDYVFAALNIYLDIINLFLYILSLFGERR